jgi:hypothetical protein
MAGKIGASLTKFTMKYWNKKQEYGSFKMRSVGLLQRFKHITQIRKKGKYK